MKKTYYIKTFGCQMNHSDSERISAILEKNNFKPIPNISKANLAVFNTCGVRQMAEDRVYGQIHNIRKHETKNKKQAMIILTGCLANRKDVQRRLKDKVDLFFPINDLKAFENWIIKNYLKIKNSKLKISQQNNSLNKENIAYLSVDPQRNNKYEAYVPIMTGCNNFCAYCVVPYARGKEVSRPAEEIIKEVKNLARKGFKHVILLGQNVNSYKFASFNFSKLLRKINAIPGKFWISFISNHPKDVTDEMIETSARCRKTCECFHLPIQAGNDEIIRKMNRNYTAKQYLNLIKKIKAAYKKYKPALPFAITSDIIVGFPGENRQQFLDSAEIMKKAKYDMVYFGQFSPRPGTAAWKMKATVSKAEKVRRENFLNEILKKTALENNKKYIGKILEVLVEKQELANKERIESESDRIIYFGKTRTMKNVKIYAIKKDLVGEIVKIKITKANIWNLEGTCCPTGSRP